MLKPRQKRPFEISSLTPASSAPSTPPADNSDSTFLQAGRPGLGGTSTPSKTRSFLNLTSSTLFGIYAPTGFATDRDETTTPWGTGAQTPAAESRNGSVDFSKMNIPDMTWHKDANGIHRRRSTASHVQHAQMRQRKGSRTQLLPLLSRTVALFGVGVLYGLFIGQLHNRRQLAPVQVEGIDSSAWPYYVFWGATGAVLGQALPWLDAYWNDSGDNDDRDIESDDGQQESGGWNEAVRTITAFVGIAFAIRKLPWESELQLSLTLALANPAVWYLIDRTPPGFILSTVVALVGTAGLLGINPTLVPPAQVTNGYTSKPGLSNSTAGLVDNEQLVLGLFSRESVGVATWISSVLFVSAVCFGNLGRRLGPQNS
ncbi:hypothetical protein K431DRAFT_215564 [Polychaeton citri CBS 116435]|uniref:INSIG-domain-containing protein n=1 Tax=Polychaeton citri CBS 116435 TaxID=1314669 RepID=A0A9P4QE22_9PEZI|nr:hypothetical protein K431DRAFT_215564 [Polychaeton citri CBS 116435]